MDYIYYKQVKKGLTSKFAPTYQEKPAPPPSQAGEKAAPAWAGPKELGSPSRYSCNVCGYVYDPSQGDPDAGVKPGTLFESLPDGWKCPVCGNVKQRFTALPA